MSYAVKIYNSVQRSEVNIFLLHPRLQL